MKLHYLDITLDEDKELIGVKTTGNVVTIVYKDVQNVRQIGFVYSSQEDTEENE